MGHLKLGEAALAKDPKYAYMYALDILKGPFKAGELAIATDPVFAFWYAKDVVSGKLFAHFY